MEILGIDIGGTGIKGAIVETKNGKLITDRHRIQTPQPATPGAILETVVTLTREFDWNGKIGCGFPAVIQDGMVKTASNIDDSWIGLKPAKQIKKATKCPTVLINDVDAAGLAEMKFGAGKVATGVTLMIAVGTGIGSALFIDKKLVPNTELGFIQVNGMAGEHYASNATKEKEELSWKNWAERLNEYLLRLESLFWPDLIILGGGVSKKFDKYSLLLETKAPLVPAEARNNAGIIGSALAAKNL